MAIIIELLFYAVGDIILYGIGRATIALLSLGHARAERFKEAITAGDRGSSNRSTQIVVPVFMTQLVGAAVLMAFFIFLFALKS